MKKKLVDLEAISDVLVSDEGAARVEQISNRAVTLVRNEGQLLPLTRGAKACLVITTQLRATQIGLRFSQEFQKRAPEGKLLSVDSALPLAALDAALPDTRARSALVVVSSVTSAVYNDKIDLPGALGDF